MLKAAIVCFFVIVVNFLYSNALLDMDMILEYIKNKNVMMGTIFSCGSKSEIIGMMRTLHSANLRFFVTNIQNRNMNLTHVLHRKYYHYAVILDGDCGNIENLLIECGDKKYFFEMYHWLIISETLEPVLSYLQNTNLNLNADVNLAIRPDKNLDNWTIFDVYNPASKHGGQFYVNQLGYYNRNEGYQAKLNGNKYWIRRNMTNVRFKSVIVMTHVNWTLEEFLTSEKDREVNSMNRFQNVVINHCRDLYNFSLQMQISNSWGYVQDTGVFDGVVRLLEKKEVDFTSSPMYYKFDRMPVIDYGYGSWILKATFIYRRPKIQAESYEIFLRPLATNVWISVAIFMLLIMLTLKLIFGSERYLLKDIYESVDSSWSFLFLFTLGAFCQQGATCYPQLLSSRIGAIFVFLFCILTYEFYSASIVSYLLMDPPRQIKNLKDLTDSNLKAGMEDVLIDRSYTVQTTDPVAIELFAKKILHSTNNSGFYLAEQGLKLVKDGGFAFHAHTASAYPIIEKTYTNEEICELEEVKLYRTQAMHTGLQKYSPFTDMLNYCMQRLIEDGTMFRIRKFWDARKPSCIETAKKITLRVGLSDFACGLIVLAYGIGFSLLFLGIEILVDKKEQIIMSIKEKKRPQIFTE